MLTLASAVLWCAFLPALAVDAFDSKPSEPHTFEIYETYSSNLHRMFARVCYLEGKELAFYQARDANGALMIFVINWGEVYYNIAKRKGFKGFKDAQEFMAKIRLLPLDVVGGR